MTVLAAHSEAVRLASPETQPRRISVLGATGSIGSSSFPSRVWKGKTLPGHMGSERVTSQRLKVIESRPDENLLFVRGAVPGAANGLLIVRKSKKG